VLVQRRYAGPLWVFHLAHAKVANANPIIIPWQVMANAIMAGRIWSASPLKVTPSTAVIATNRTKNHSLGISPATGFSKSHTRSSNALVAFNMGKIGPVSGKSESHTIARQTAPATSGMPIVMPGGNSDNGKLYLDIVVNRIGSYLDCSRIRSRPRRVDRVEFRQTLSRRR
jgi:hypothetical protein